MRRFVQTVLALSSLVILLAAAPAAQTQVTVGASTSGRTSSALAGGEPLIVPEPTSIALIGSGLLALGGVLKRRMRR